ncbi:trihelix transcription factor DF1-like [Impatiens glandulifera]|uniref:trihelix transcription factor DF1-like n=1 Tax=Impatiens glandulifera TaxID=253017 RepID=UPI001FB18B53|nr:trihelix transcription factor DF1-like [Impatiens glandulifera]
MPEDLELREISAIAATATAVVPSSSNLNDNNGSGEFGEEVGGAEGGGMGMGDGDRSFPGNRWPREETLALLKIRSEMDFAFRDSTIKAPLWDEVSRKLAELGYIRSPKKCKEKFENIYKYHKRTKECRSGRQNNKSYRFFEQLELLDYQSSLPLPSPSYIHSQEPSIMTSIVPTTKNPFTIPQNIPIRNSELFISTSTSTTSSSEKDIIGDDKKKKKLADFFERLMKEVLEKQESLQSKFIEALEKCEHDRIAREENWKTQELARIEREKELLAQERAIAAAKDAAVLSFLQNISEKAGPGPGPVQMLKKTIFETPSLVKPLFDKKENGIVSSPQMGSSSSSRWPKAEVEDLIKLRTNLDLQYQDNGPKGPLWEDVSIAMKKLGYDRSSKRCKEKWENINKYFKRVKESNKKRPVDSKSCPYFELLESLRVRKFKKGEDPSGSGTNLNPVDETPIMDMMGQQKNPLSVNNEYCEDQNEEEVEDDGSDNEEESRDTYEIGNKI